MSTVRPRQLFGTNVERLAHVKGGRSLGAADPVLRGAARQERGFGRPLHGTTQNGSASETLRRIGSASDHVLRQQLTKALFEIIRALPKPRGTPTVGPRQRRRFFVHPIGGGLGLGFEGEEKTQERAALHPCYLLGC